MNPSLLQWDNTIAAIEAYEAFQWELADAFFADNGTPPKTLAATIRLITPDIDELRSIYCELEEPEQWAQYWRAAAAFPDKSNRPKQIGTAIKVRDALTWELLKLVRKNDPKWTFNFAVKVARRGAAQYRKEQAIDDTTETETVNRGPRP